MIRVIKSQDVKYVGEYIDEDKFEKLNEHYGDLEIIEAILSQKEGEYIAYVDKEIGEVIVIELETAGASISKEDRVKYADILKQIKEG